MEARPNQVNISGFTFLSNFDSANLGKIELVPWKPSPPIPPNPPGKKKAVAANVNRPAPKPAKAPPLIEVPDYEFNIWTNPDCCGTEFENGNRTWFYFGIRGGPPFSLVKLNIIDLNKQSRMYREGMAPVYKVCPGRPWERIRDKPVYTVEDNVFTLSFKYRTLESPKATIYFAFTYPFSYVDLQNYLGSIDARISKFESRTPKLDVRFSKFQKLINEPDDLMYYHREVACYSIEGRRVDLITISSYHNITKEREPRLPNLFPDPTVPRPFKFQGKKVIFVSARVHPGETPSSFVLNGLLNLLVSKDDPVALLLRRQFVFKLIPMLNPDGVARGHYRTDTRGANLNRFYLRPSFSLQPSIYAARSLIRYYHYGIEMPEDCTSYLDGEPVSHSEDTSPEEMSSSTETLPLQDLSIKSSRSSLSSESIPLLTEPGQSEQVPINNQENPVASGLLMYMDMHGHASKKGIFMYGNHFDRVDDIVECMLFPKILSLNSQNFHFAACNFTERNMYLRDKRDGTSREGSGRVAVLRLTGAVRSYTLECNYNTGRLVNILPSCSRELPGRPPGNLLSPPKYTPTVYEETGRAIGLSILDLTNSNPWTRIPNSEFHTIAGIRDWLKLKALSENFEYRRGSDAPRVKGQSQTQMSLRLSKGCSKESLLPRSAPSSLKNLDNPTTSERWESGIVKEGQISPQKVGRSNALCLKNSKDPREKQAKFKFSASTEGDGEKKVSLSTISLGLNCPDASNKPKGDSCAFKQSPKRLKISKEEPDVVKSKKMVLKKDVAIEGPSGVGVFSKLPRPLSLLPSTSDPTLPPTTKKRAIKPRTQLSPMKYKKSLEKRRNGDGSRKKTKILYKKCGKLAVSSNDICNIERKKRKGVVTEH